MASPGVIISVQAAFLLGGVILLLVRIIPILGGIIAIIVTIFGVGALLLAYRQRHEHAQEI